MPLLKTQSLSHIELPEHFGRYRIIRKIAEGGMGAVYLAEDQSLGRRVALKIPHFTEDPKNILLQRFLNEARIAAKVEHPNLCKIYDVGEIEDVHYITMPYIQGPTLSALISPEHPWPASKALRLVHQLAMALQSLHKQGIVHRDLKPGNVMLQNNRDPIIMDFGIARKYDSASRHLTQDGTTLGTPAYMPPEQLMGEIDEIGPGTDIYSLGVILYQILTGHLPFDGDFNTIYAQILHKEPKAPSEIVAEISPEVDDLCLKAMMKKHEDRYSSMNEFAQAIEPLLEDFPNSDSELIPQETLAAYVETLAAEPVPGAEGQLSDAGPVTMCLNLLLPLLPWVVTVGFMVYWTAQDR